MSSRILPLIITLLLLAQTAFAQEQIPFEGGRPQVEYKKTGNTYQWKPVTEKMPSKGVVFGSGHGVSTAEPKVVSQGKLPYPTKAGALPGSVKAASRISPTKFGKVAGGILRGAAAATAGVASGGFVPLSMLACTFYCQDLFDLIGDEIVGFRTDENGDIEFLAESDDPDFIDSDGYLWSTSPSMLDPKISPGLACKRYGDNLGATSSYVTPRDVATYNCYLSKVGGFQNWLVGAVYRGSLSSCPAGRRIQISTGKCFEPGDEGYSKKSQAEYEAAFGRYASDSSAWSNSRAPHLAAKLAPQYDILDESQPADVTGPASAPISETVTRENLNLQPGTTTPAAPGHVGPTDSGTRTTTKTTTARNSYSGDTMTTTTVTNTTTNITNNITNTTINTGTSEEETDQAPKQDKPTCEEKPDSLECAELDTPEGEIPRDEIQITFEPDDLGLGGGSCPADRELGGSYVFSYAATCDMLSSYGRYLVWILASMSALMIIFAGRAEA